MKRHLILLLILINPLILRAQTDKDGCEDHPLISRYPGSVIEYCNSNNFIEYAIATGPETGYREIDSWEHVSGKQTRIYYSITGEKTVTEVYQNYLSALQTEEFTMIANKLHPERNVSREVGGNTWLVTFYRANPFPSNEGIKINQGSGTMGGTFYITANRENIYITISGKRYSDDETVVLLDVLETEEIEDDLITVNADYIADELFSNGKIALDGILFDYNEETIKDESIPLLNEIAAFLNEHQTVVIFVVGHTDMTGNVDYNMSLSDRRAKAVVHYLETEHHINADRLLPYGVGPLAPVGTNITDTGRTKNRRVELVLKSR